MKKVFLFFIFLISSLFINAQDYELRITPYLKSEIVLKNGDTLKGLVKFNNSAFDVRFKLSEDAKRIKVDYKEIEKLITNPNSENERTFQYLENYKNKFLKFVELVYSDELKIYIELKDRVTHFYSDFDRTSINEALTAARFNNQQFKNFPISSNQFDSINLYNGKQIKLPVRYSYFYESGYSYSISSSMKVYYYVLLVDDPKLIPITSYKDFKKKYLQYFNDCPLFVEKFGEEEIDLRDLPQFIESYKEICN
jgi:hypothetical protein